MIEVLPSAAVVALKEIRVRSWRRAGFAPPGRSRGALFGLLAVGALVLAGCSASTSNDLNVYVAYADNGSASTHQIPANYPHVWKGSQNVNFVGNGDHFDAGAIRVENTTGNDVTVQGLSVDIDQQHYALWGSNLKVPANGSLIVTQTQITNPKPLNTNFDTSEAAGQTCTPATLGGVPVIHLTVNGKTTDLRDSGKILNSGGKDVGQCANSPNESHDWTHLATLAATTNNNSRFDWGSLLPLGIAAALIALFSFIPALIGGLLLLLIGWLLARWAARAVAALLDRIGFGPAVERTGLFAFLGGRRNRRYTNASWVLGILVGVLVFLVFAQLAGQALHLPALAGLLTAVGLWLPKLISAVAIILVGAMIAKFLGGLVRGAVAASGFGNADLFATIAQVGVIAFAVMVAVDHVGIGTPFVQTLLAGILGAIALAAGIAFGLGGRATAAQILQRWYSGSGPGAGGPRQLT